MNEQPTLWEDIATVLRIAMEHTKVNTPEFCAILRVMDAKKHQPTTPEPAGETVRVRAGVWISRSQPDSWYVDGQSGCSLVGPGDDEPDAIIEADVPLPRIPTVAARVVEGQS